MIIYKAENILNNKIYIGQTTKTLEKRKQAHLNKVKNGSQFYFHSAIRYHGEDNFVWSIIDTANSIQELNEKENYWIEYYKSYKYGYNCTKGDNNPMNHDITKLKHDKKMRSPEVRAKISSSMKQLIANGKMFSEEHRKKISQKLKGNKHFQGHKRSPEAIEASARSLRKNVACYDENNNLINSFDSVKEAAKWLYNNRCSHLKNWKDLQNRIKESNDKQKYYKGLIWRYK